MHNEAFAFASHNGLSIVVYYVMNMPTDSKRILIVDKDPSIREALQILLQEKKFHVDTCSIEHWKEKFLNHTHQLAIIGIPLKEYGGKIREVVKHIKTHSKCSILVTSTDKRVKNILKYVGANDFLEEPFDVDKFYAKVSKVFSVV